MTFFFLNNAFPSSPLIFFFSRKFAPSPAATTAPFDVVVRRAHALHIRITALARISWISSLH